MNKKLVLATAFIAVLLFSALAGVQFVRLAAANFLPPPPRLPSIYIRSDGSVDPPAPIQRDGKVYTFTGNIANYTIEVQRDNIVVDGAGYTLQGNGSGTGIDLSNRSSITIKNIEIKQLRTGIKLFNSSNTIISGNNIANNDVGVGLHSSSNNHIEGNTITGNNAAILLYDSSNHNSIVGNSITDNGDGIWSEFNPNPSNYNSIVGNNITNTRFGILIRSSSNDLIEGNTIANTEHGIWLSGSSCQYNTIVGNNIINNDYGISLGGDPKYNSIVENNIANNGKGIYFSQSSNNIIYNNNFIDNTIQVYDIIVEFPDAAPSVNIWDDGYSSGGNYWSNYTGQDANGDNIGDSPHIIDGNNQDNYPLMETAVIPEFPTWTPILLLLAVLAVAKVISKRRTHRRSRRKKYTSPEL